jgi:transposase-like protein
LAEASRVRFRRRAWQHVVPFFAFPKLMRKVVYTTDVIENLHMQLRKIIKNRGHFPSDEAVTKLPWLALATSWASG